MYYIEMTGITNNRLHYYQWAWSSQSFLLEKKQTLKAPLERNISLIYIKKKAFTSGYGKKTWAHAVQVKAHIHSDIQHLGTRTVHTVIDSQT